MEHLFQEPRETSSQRKKWLETLQRCRCNCGCTQKPGRLVGCSQCGSNVSGGCCLTQDFGDSGICHRCQKDPAKLAGTRYAASASSDQVLHRNQATHPAYLNPSPQFNSHHRRNQASSYNHEDARMAARSSLEWLDERAGSSDNNAHMLEDRGNSFLGLKTHDNSASL